MLQSFPLEILQHIFSYVGKDGLASICRASQVFNQVATAELYRDVVLDIYMTQQFPYIPEFAEVWTAGLQTLAMNTRNQCENVQSFTLTNSHPGHLLPPLPGALDTGEYCADGYDTFPNCVQKYPSLVFVSTLVEIALARMHGLKDFTWTIPLCPSNALLAALFEKDLRSFTFRYCDDISTLDRMNICPTQPDLQIATRSRGLTSLRVMDIGSDKAIEGMNTLLFGNRRSLQSLQIGYVTGYCYKNRNIGRLRQMNISMEQWSKCKLLPILRDIIEADDPLKLHTLEIHKVETIDTSTWLKAFDFRSIRNFALVLTQRFPRPDPAPKLWRCLKDMKISFNRLVTDAQSPELIELIGSFEGLETFLDDILNTLSGSSALRCIYIVTCLKKGTEDPLYSFKPYEFIDYFFKYFRQNPSPFFDRLEMLSYSRALYELHPTELDEDEREELKYEFTCRRIINEDEEEEEEDEEIEDTDDEYFPIKDRHYGEEYISHVFDEPYPDLIEKKKLSKVHQKMPVRVKWRDYTQSTIVNAVRFYVSSENWGEELFHGDYPIYEECPCGNHEFDESCWDGIDVPKRVLCGRRCDVLFPSSSSSSRFV